MLVSTSSLSRTFPYLNSDGAAAWDSGLQDLTSILCVLKEIYLFSNQISTNFVNLCATVQQQVGNI